MYFKTKIVNKVKDIGLYLGKGIYYLDKLKVGVCRSVVISKICLKLVKRFQLHTDFKM